jgi:hypothetical protein
LCSLRLEKVGVEEMPLSPAKPAMGTRYAADTNACKPKAGNAKDRLLDIIELRRRNCEPIRPDATFGSHLDS